MNDEYVGFRCLKCGLVFIITKEGLSKGQAMDKYISCPYGHRRIEKMDPYEKLNECMNQKHSALI